jgi:phosphoenolpyruvate-protein kinase (PTS system EI component)
MAKASAGQPFIIRVFDFGSDKGWNDILGEIHGFSQNKRALSILLDNPHILYTQVRAIMRASRFGMLSILFPMVSSREELDRCLEIVEAVYKDISREISIAFPKIGAMIETPSIIFRTAEVAKKVDFLSLGTNDLIQYALAIDRGNATVFDYRITFHPGLLFLLQLVVEESIKAKIPLCVCGEMAADPLFVSFLVGLGITQLSMAPRLSPMVRRILETFSLQEMKDVAKKVLEVQSAQEAYVLLRTHYAKVEEF